MSESKHYDGPLLMAEFSKDKIGKYLKLEIELKLKFGFWREASLRAFFFATLSYNKKNSNEQIIGHFQR